MFVIAVAVLCLIGGFLAGTALRSRRHAKMMLEAVQYIQKQDREIDALRMLYQQSKASPDLTDLNKRTLSL